MLKKIAAVALLAATAFTAQSASAAALLGQEPAPGVIVTRNSLEWVYASPCAPGGCSSILLHHGFRYATADEWTSSFANLADLVGAFTNPNKCAATYFDRRWNHCDYGNLRSGYVWDSPFGRNISYGETFLVRGEQVPAPAALGLLGLGVLGIAAARRRKTA